MEITQNILRCELRKPKIEPMSKKIAILRGINVGGKRKILMKDLKVLFAAMGHQNISTYIQSGNVFFEADPSIQHLELAKQISESIQAKYGFDVPVIVRTHEELAAAIQNNPFYREDPEALTQYHLTFLNEKPTSENQAQTASYDYTPDQFVIKDKEVFIKCAGKYHQTKLSNNFFEKKLKVQATTRNWKTVLKLFELSK